MGKTDDQGRQKKYELFIKHKAYKAEQTREYKAKESSKNRQHELRLTHIYASVRQTTISDKSYGNNCYLDNFVFLSPSPSYQYSGTISETCGKECYGFKTLHRGRGGILNTLSKVTTIFCH